jgi:hypothetical protein
MMPSHLFDTATDVRSMGISLQVMQCVDFEPPDRHI